MIEINLLPEELKKKASPFGKIDFSAFKLEKVPILPIAAGFVALLVALEVLALGLGIYYNISFGALKKRYDLIMPQKSQADALKAQYDMIHKRAAAIDELMGKRFSWARKLNQLSDAVTPGIWLSELDYSEQADDIARPASSKVSSLPGMLIINGYAAGVGEQGASLVGKFIKSLKDDPGFYSDFGDIKLVAVKSDKAENQEVMSFKINCIFK